MEMISKSFRLERGSSLRLGRSNSSLLVSELASSDLAKITGYQRLSESMRLNGIDSGGYGHRRRKSSAWAFLSKVFSSRKIGGDHVIVRKAEESAPKTPQAAATAEERKKRRSPWLPDPHRRWPVQGW